MKKTEMASEILSHCYSLGDTLTTLGYAMEFMNFNQERFIFTGKLFLLQFQCLNLLILSILQNNGRALGYAMEFMNYIDNREEELRKIASNLSGAIECLKESEGFLLFRLLGLIILFFFQ